MVKFAPRLIMSCSTHLHFHLSVPRAVKCLLICTPLLWAFVAPLAETATFNPATPAQLIADINTSNGNAEADTINLTDTTYTFNAVDNIVYGNNALPVITTSITINGNGAVFENGSWGSLRFFNIDAAGDLTLKNLTLKNSLAKGGDGGDGDGERTGGGAAGLGGALFNQGTLDLKGITFDANTAQGGAGGMYESGFFVGTKGGGGGGVAEAGFLDGGNPNGGALDRLGKLLLLIFGRINLISISI